MNSILLALLFSVVGFLAGLAVGAVGMLVVGGWVGMRMSARNSERNEEDELVEDLSALAVEVLDILERPLWDNATVLHMARWLHEHRYTSLSDPNEIADVVRREC